MIFLFLGPAGSGKDTQADLLAKVLDIPVIGTGDLLRKELEKGSELGKEIKDLMDSGIIIPDKYVIEVLKNELVKEDYKNGFIMTGYPRAVSQILPFDRILEKLGMKITNVVHFKLDEAESIKRMQQQAKDNPGKRTDTDIESMKNRYRTMYTETINPIIEAYEKRGLIVHVDASPSVEEIHGEVRSKLKIENE
jgi:adenylate kinase